VCLLACWIGSAEDWEVCRSVLSDVSEPVELGVLEVEGILGCSSTCSDAGCYRIDMVSAHASRIGIGSR
jgi:hypothetical protein